MSQGLNAVSEGISGPSISRLHIWADILAELIRVVFLSIAKIWRCQLQVLNPDLTCVRGDTARILEE